MDISNFYKKKLDNGLTVLFEKRKVPVVSTITAVNFGAKFESEKEKGIAHLIEHLLFKGTAKRNYEEIAREIEKKGGILNGYTGEEITAFWDKMPDKHFETGFDVVSDIIVNPAFDEKEFEKEKGVVIEEIKMYHDNPLFFVMDKIKECLYKKPFGMSVAGTEEIIRGIGHDSVKSFFNKHYKTNRMVLGVVGNADFEDICERAKKVFPKTKAEFPFPKIEKRSMEVVEKRNGIDQAHFVFGFHMPTLLQKERYEWDIAMAYLAEGMSSVLFNEIREKRGLAYSVRADEDLGRDYGFGTIYVGTKAENVKMIKEIILKEFKNLKNLKQKDFDEAKEQMIGINKVLEEDSTKVMNNLLVEEYGKGAEEYYKLEENLNAVKIKNVQALKIKDFASVLLEPASK